MSGQRAVWYGFPVDDREVFNPGLLADFDRLADAARAGDWARVLGMVDGAAPLAGAANQWRPGGTSWFAPLHQAAWHGAPTEVVERLLGSGAWLTLVDARGRRPVDVARQGGHEHLVEILEPSFERHQAPSERDRAAMNAHLAALVVDVARPVTGGQEHRIRHVDVTQLFEDAGATGLDFPIPGMYGGFYLDVFLGRVHVRSWSLVVGGSGRYHVVTASGAVLVEEGFV